MDRNELILAANRHLAIDEMQPTSPASAALRMQPGSPGNFHRLKIGGHFSSRTKVPR
jgi:hypothetical protein